MIETYNQLNRACSAAMNALPNDRKGTQIKMGLDSLYRMSLRGTINQVAYIFTNAEELIKYCLRKPRSEEELKKHINCKVK